MPVSQKKCKGRSLYNHLTQKNVPVNVEYKFNRRWEGTLTVYDTTFKVSGKQSKNMVLEALMQDAHSFIWCNLSSK